MKIEITALLCKLATKPICPHTGNISEIAI